MNKAATTQLSADLLRLSTVLCAASTSLCGIVSTVLCAASVSLNWAAMVASLQRRIVQAYHSCLESSSSLD